MGILDIIRPPRPDSHEDIVNRLKFILETLRIDGGFIQAEFDKVHAELAEIKALLTKHPGDGSGK